MHFDILDSEIDDIYLRLHVSSKNILRFVENLNNSKGFFNPKRDSIVETENIDEFKRFQSIVKNLDNYIYYNSLLLVCCSILEHSLKEICFFIENHSDPQKIFNNPNTDILNKCLSFIDDSKLVNFKSRQTEKTVLQIKQVQKLRNLIAHYNGNLMQEKCKVLTKQKYFHLFDSDKRLLILDNGQVYINDSEYITSFIICSESLLRGILNDIKKQLPIE